MINFHIITRFDLGLTKDSQLTLQRWCCPYTPPLHIVIPISLISHSPESRKSKL